eukprot:gene12670-26685_t
MSEANKRQRDDDSDSNSDDDFGPLPAEPDNTEVVSATSDSKLKEKKIRKLEFENIFIEKLPSCTLYEYSYMHRDVVTHIAVSKAAEFIITGSIDGHVKFWKKMQKDIEFVKHFQAHLGPIHALVLSPDTLRLVTTSQDKMIKFFDVLGFDMSNMIALDYVPGAATWLSSPGGVCNRVAVADTGSSRVLVYQSEGVQTPVLQVDIHGSPVKCMALNVHSGFVVSADSRGVIEYWHQVTGQPPSPSPSHTDSSSSVYVSVSVSFRFKTDTDLYDM